MLAFTKEAIVDDDDYEKVKPYNWFLSGTGYAVAFVPVDGKFKLTYLHRFIMDAQPGQCVDHINGNSLDNRRNNLRLATVYQANGRVKEFRVTAGSVAETWALTDTPDPQELRKDLGTTTSVVLEVVSVYPGDKYLDLAVTDITFLTTAP